MVAEQDQTFKLQPDWHYNLLPYLISILLVPVGIGIILFFYFRSRISHLRYVITNNEVRVCRKDEETSISIRHVERFSITRNRSERLNNLGTLVIEGEGKRLNLLGIRSPEEIRRMLQQARDVYRRTDEIFDKERGWHNELKTGGIAFVDDLVGLWQQGLLSDEEFERESRRFTN